MRNNKAVLKAVVPVVFSLSVLTALTGCTEGNLAKDERVTVNEEFLPSNQDLFVLPSKREEQFIEEIGTVDYSSISHAKKTRAQGAIVKGHAKLMANHIDTMTK